MNESHRLAMQVGHEMLRSFGQGEDGTQINQLGNYRLRIRKFLTQQA